MGLKERGKGDRKLAAVFLPPAQLKNPGKLFRRRKRRGARCLFVGFFFFGLVPPQSARKRTSAGLCGDEGGEAKSSLPGEAVREDSIPPIPLCPNKRQRLLKSFLGRKGGQFHYRALARSLASFRLQKAESPEKGGEEFYFSQKKMVDQIQERGRKK